MKIKKIKGKLALNKKTVAHLNSQQLDHVKGGAPTVGTCLTCGAYTECDSCTVPGTNTCDCGTYICPPTTQWTDCMSGCIECTFPC